MTTIPFTFDLKDDPWVLPYRGTVGMWCLITAESAMFLIFVVAYIFYLGKSLSGPTPKEVLELPIFDTICLLSSSITVHLSVNGLQKRSQMAFIGWLAVTMLLGIIFLLGTAQEWNDLIFKARIHHPHQPVRHHVLFSGRFARHPRRRRTIDVECCFDSGTVRQSRTRTSSIAFTRYRMYWHFVDAVWVVVFLVVYVIGR